MGPATADLAAGLLALRHDIATAEHPDHREPLAHQTARRLGAVRPRRRSHAADPRGARRTAQTADPRAPAPDAGRGRRSARTRRGTHPARAVARPSFLDHPAGSGSAGKCCTATLIWHLLRRLRSRNNGRPTTRQQALRIRHHRRAAEAFLDWLDTHDLTLATFGQPDLDRWLTDPAGGYRYEAGTFIRWAHANKLTTAYLPADAGAARSTRSTTITAGRPPAGSCTTARSTPKTVSPGCSCCLYAQGPVHDQPNDHRPDHDHRRRSSGSASAAPQSACPTPSTTWPAPSSPTAKATPPSAPPRRHAGCSPEASPGARSAPGDSPCGSTGLGIRPNQARSTALFQLATEIPAAILARTLGNQRRLRRPLATDLRRRLDQLRRRRQPAIHPNYRGQPEAFRQFEYPTSPFPT